MKRPIRDQILWPLITLLTAAVAFNAIVATWRTLGDRKRCCERHSQVVRVMEQASFPLSQTIIDDLGQSYRVTSCGMGRINGTNRV